MVTSGKESLSSFTRGRFNPNVPIEVTREMMHETWGEKNAIVFNNCPIKNLPLRWNYAGLLLDFIRETKKKARRFRIPV